MTNKPINIPGRRKVITKNMILESQKHTKSNMEAARWIGVSYNTYRKWAKYYDIFEQHLNQAGFGVKKGWATYKVPVHDIITGKRKPPKRWSHKVLKKRLIEDGYMQEECAVCGYNETNLKTKNVCLAIDFIDGDHQNFLIDNIRFLCANCYLSFNGLFPSSKVFCKQGGKMKYKINDTIVINNVEWSISEYRMGRGREWKYTLSYEDTDGSYTTMSLNERAIDSITLTGQMTILGSKKS